MLKNERIQLSIIAVFAVIVLFAKLGAGGLASFDDCYYGQQAKEILQTGDWLTLHYQGKPLHENDPVCLWSMAFMFKTFGISEFSARAHSAFFGVLTIILLYFLGRLLYNHWTGIFSSVILLTTQIFTKYARHAMLDVTLSFFVILSLFFFAKAVKEDEQAAENSQGFYFLLFGISTGIAILTKNLLGVFPLLTAVLYTLFNKGFTGRYTFKLLFAAVIALALPSIWYLYSYKTSGTEFFKVHFGYILFDRALKENAGKQDFRSYTSYALALFKFYQPWIFPALAGFILMITKWVKERDRGSLILIIHATLTLFILSASNARKIWYLMPVFPVFAVMASLFANKYILKTEKTRFAALASLFGAGAVLSLVILFTPVRLDWDRNADLKAIAPYVKEIVPENRRILTYQTEEYFAVQLPLIFYSDRSADYPITKKEDLLGLLKGKEQVYCLTYLKPYNELGNWQIIARYGELIFFTNKPLQERKLPLYENLLPYKIRR
ncbi:MAG: glycosyltransferase family 39 protein [Candidatus Firestonebacteria bacterium]